MPSGAGSEAMKIGTITDRLWAVSSITLPARAARLEVDIFRLPARRGTAGSRASE